MHRLYYPLTAHPFSCNEAYMELPPCAALQPYIRCFWGTARPVIVKASNHLSIITPDTCMDIIFTADYTANTLSAGFCGINDQTIASHVQGTGHLISTFAIRFFPWSASLFAADTLAGTKNAFLPADALYASVTRAIMPRLFDGLNLQQLAALAEKPLLDALHPSRQIHTLHNCLHDILTARGHIRTTHLAARQQVSTRQLERFFSHHIGMGPKQLSTLIRYQQVLRDAVYLPSFDVQDAVAKYGYADQSHLLHEFNKYHTMTPAQARAFALEHR